MFVLGEKIEYCDGFYELYTGKTFMVQGEHFPITTKHKEEAKKYTTKTRAENACDKLIKKSRKTV